MSIKKVLTGTFYEKTIDEIYCDCCGKKIETDNNINIDSQYLEYEYLLGNNLDYCSISCLVKDYSKRDFVTPFNIKISLDMNVFKELIERLKKAESEDK